MCLLWEGKCSVSCGFQSGGGKSSPVLGRLVGWGSFLFTPRLFTVVVNLSLIKDCYVGNGGFGLWGVFRESFASVGKV